MLVISKLKWSLWLLVILSLVSCQLGPATSPATSLPIIESSSTPAPTSTKRPVATSTKRPTKAPETPTPTPTPVVSQDLCFAGHPDDNAYDREKAEMLYEFMGEANAKWIRHDIDQVVAEKEQRWPYYEEMLGWAEDQQMGTILTVNFTGAADQDWEEVFSSPEKYARFAGDVAAFAAGKKVWYEMGNEPDQDGVAPEEYLDFLILGGEAIREAYKEAGIDEEPIIISAGIPHGNAAYYLDAMFDELDARHESEAAAKRAKEELFDYFGYHFQDTIDDLYGIDGVLEVMSEHGVEKQIIITEGGTDRAGDEEADQQEQADFLLEMYETLKSDYPEEVAFGCVYRISNKRSDEELRGVLNETRKGFDTTLAYDALVDYFNAKP